jgi:uncharacterized protein YbbC (DUF1343 family)
MNLRIGTLFICLLIFASVISQPVTEIIIPQNSGKEIKYGAIILDKYVPLLNGKNVAIVANQTTIIGKTHLVDSLLILKVNIKKIFFPEHGFRGDKDAGANVKSYKDYKTGITCVSLYGKENKKPKPDDLKDIDVVIFDLQDVGVRFYTYISTLHYVMEACAENNKPLIILDRPNPNGFYVDGPMMEEKYKSFVGMHNVPIVHGMTIGEYAQMINGEGWLANKIQCKLTIVKCDDYTHKDYYQLPVNPSPNLQNMSSIYMYPSMCLFEGTIVSVGRGTNKPFQCFGYPGMPDAPFKFTPKPIKGASSNPLYNGKECSGYDVASYGDIYIKYYKKMYLYWIINSYKTSADKTNFFNTYFMNLCGTDKLKSQIIAGLSEEEIRKTWIADLANFKKVRKKYLLYPDFE